MKLSSTGFAKSMLAGAAGLALLLAAGTASAQTQPVGQSAPAAKDKDPNRIICERIEDTGSRIAGRKVCLTAQQWAEQRQRDRENVEDAQRRRTEPSGG